MKIVIRGKRLNKYTLARGDLILMSCTDTNIAPGNTINLKLVSAKEIHNSSKTLN